MSLKIVAISFDKSLFSMDLALWAFNLETNLGAGHVMTTDTKYVISNSYTRYMYNKYGWHDTIQDYYAAKNVTCEAELAKSDLCILSQIPDLTVPIANGITYHVMTSRIGTQFWKMQAKYFK
jgi:hypothetical protein